MPLMDVSTFLYVCLCVYVNEIPMFDILREYIIWCIYVINGRH